MYREIDEQLQEWKVSKNRKPLILSGARQVGKTYSLQEFGKNHFKQCHYLNLEKLPDLQDVFEGNLRPDSIVKEIELRLGKRIDVNSDLVVLDEIQAIPNALTSLKYFAEDLPQLAICSAGSLLGIQLNEQSFPVGKTDRLWLGPLKFKEFLTAFGRTLELEAYKDALRENIITLNAHKVLQEHFRLFSTIGGLPEVVRTFMEYQQNFQEGLQKTREKQLTILKDYYDDIAKHSGKVNAFDITRVLSSIPMQLGRNIEDGASKFTFKNVLPGKSNYQTLCNPIEWLVRAGLIYKINIANESELPISSYAEENRFKLYMFDIGILGALSEIPINLLYLDEYGTAKGAFAENVALQLLVKDSRHEMYSWQKNTAEIEFLTTIPSVNPDISPALLLRVRISGNIELLCSPTTFTHSRRSLVKCQRD
jgi:predicted AAA+ superfamily ATPase